MIDRTPTNVSAAFDILLETMEEEIDLVERSVGIAADRSEYGQAREALDRAETMTELREQLSELRRKWEGAFPEEEHSEDEDEQLRPNRRDLGRLQRGLRTQQDAYYRPILQVLEQMGGSGRAGNVIDCVGQVMQGTLRDVDYELLRSQNTVRWRNTARWARNEMVREGLLKEDSPHRTWEISEQGRRYLQDQQL